MAKSKTENMRMRVTLEEKRDIESAAEERGQSAAAWLRDAARERLGAELVAKQLGRRFDKRRAS